jgi:ubiquinone/menaquinone biosynthesis C-methylase UbiE
MSVSREKKKIANVWGASPAGTTHAAGAVPGTKEFFERVMNIRSTYELPWLSELIPFSSFRDKRIIEVGCGAGYDAFEFCRNGANYIAIDITPENVDRTKKHLGYYDYKPEVMVGDAENLQFKKENFDVVFSNGVLHHTPDIVKSFQEVYRVLRSGGEFWVIVYHRDSIFYWVSLLLTSYILRLGFLKRSFKERLAMIEYTTSDELPIVNVYSRKTLKAMLVNTGFVLEFLCVRKLTREDLPGIPVFSRLYRFIPQEWLNQVGKLFGWYLIARAKKV